MATFDQFRSVVPAPRGFFANLLAAALTWSDRRGTVRALRALTDRELADIGLTRGDVEEMAHRR
ncbi:DUF1127 domain-containing protein [Jannaschia aquimarina]|uniref:YjiS-like domain-containing protein n=1 Tax=Jannaschia aquimarina TaxID=935700 RepID=A0A0D1EFL9_9RHOB|nr:DUF1127 domain-containing protein [Jannaschia aquimarina]KIT16459.1 hypothetical protein jaqu_18460 [Jannaschia aquimarina]SNS92889.1 Uncharacterized conserved protein YjiS, DUF1127 family [Jannaschia aquimarina]